MLALALAAVGVSCGGSAPAAQTQADAGAPASGVDAGAADAGAIDAGVPDVGAVDAGALDAGAVDAGEPDAGAADAGDGGDADAGAADAGAADAGSADGGSASFTLNLTNFAAWCTLSVTQPSGATFPNDASAPANSLVLPAGTVVKLHGEPADSDFVWPQMGDTGGWSGDLDPGQDPLSKDVTVTLGADKTVNVCCPYVGGTGC